MYEANTDADDRQSTLMLEEHPTSKVPPGLLEVFYYKAMIAPESATDEHISQVIKDSIHRTMTVFHTLDSYNAFTQTND